MTTTEGPMTVVATIDDNMMSDKGKEVTCFSRGRNFWTFACGLLLLMAAIGGLIFVVVDRPSLVVVDEEGIMADPNEMTASERERIQQRNDAYYLQLRHAVLAQVYNGKYDPFIFVRPNSPQRLAMQWMAYEDTLHLPLNATALSANVTNDSSNDSSIVAEAPKFRWIQRYVLMTIYFANSGDAWAIFGGNSNTSDTSCSSVVAPLGAISEQQEATLALAASTTIFGSSWASNIGVPECQWELIGCDAEDHITEASFNGVSVTLSGMLSEEIGLLSYLRFLDVSQNQLKGTIPKGIYELTYLEQLDLSGNKFVSKIDSRIGHLQNLTHLSLRGNLLTGDLPSTFQYLTNLQVFNMASNADLGGPVLNYTVDWKQLEHLDISESVVSGTIPSELGMLIKMTSLSLWSVLLTGTIPSELGQLVALKDIIIGKKRPKNLVGNLPSEIGLWTNMVDFRLMQTELTGTIPSGVGSWSNAQEFLLRNSPGIRGTIPTEMGLMTNLSVLQLYDTSIRGTIPSELGLLTNADELCFHSTKVGGTMPDEICELDLLHLTADCLEISAGIAPQLECGTCCSDCYAF